MYTLTRGELALSPTHHGRRRPNDVISGNNARRVLSVAGTSDSVTGVTIRNGNGVGTTASGLGGGVFIAAAAVMTLTNSTVSGNAWLDRRRRRIAVAGTLRLGTSTVSGNVASTVASRAAAGSPRHAGGAAIVNSTISGNRRVDT